MQHGPEFQGMSQVLDACATACEGVLQQAEQKNLENDARQRIERAIEACREAARAVR